MAVLHDKLEAKDDTLTFTLKNFLSLIIIYNCVLSPYKIYITFKQIDRSRGRS